MSADGDLHRVTLHLITHLPEPLRQQAAHIIDRETADDVLDMLEREAPGHRVTEELRESVAHRNHWVWG